MSWWGVKQLAATARENGIRRLLADTLVENAAMLRVFAGSGFEQVRRLDSGVVELVLDTAYRPSTLERMADRERSAEDRSLQRLFSPRVIAVIGAGRTPGGIGHEVLRNVVKGNFTGDVYAVNPHAGRVADVPSYLSVGEVPGVVDLAVIAVPAGQVPQVLTECGIKGVGGAVVLTAGFSELGAAGGEAQREILEIARRYSIRLIGPNCLGLVNTDPAINLNATFAEVSPTPGALAIAAQSGAVGIAVLDTRRHQVERVTDRATRTKIGQLETEEDRQLDADVAQRERDLAAGHGDVRWLGLIVVSADNQEGLDDACMEIEIAATQALLDLRRLVGQQMEGFLAAACLSGLDSDGDATVRVLRTGRG